jgi:hypothetical protein
MLRIARGSRVNLTMTILAIHPTEGNVTLVTVGEAAEFLASASDEKRAKDADWLRAAKSLEFAAQVPQQAEHATEAVLHHEKMLRN